MTSTSDNEVCGAPSAAQIQEWHLEDAEGAALEDLRFMALDLLASRGAMGQG